MPPLLTGLQAPRSSFKTEVMMGGPWHSRSAEHEGKDIMGDDRNRILELLAAGKITAEEAGRLLDALESEKAEIPVAEGEARAGAGSETGAQSGGRSGFHKLFQGAKTAERTGVTGAPKYLFVKVTSVKGENVNIKIPLALLRAGLKLTSLIPQQAQDQINKMMAEKGMSFDLGSLKSQDLEDIVEALREMEVDIDSGEGGDKVRVYTA